MPDPDGDQEPDPQDPGEAPALELDDMPNRPLTAARCEALIPKIVG